MVNAGPSEKHVIVAVRTRFYCSCPLALKDTQHNSSKLNVECVNDSLHEVIHIGHLLAGISGCCAGCGTALLLLPCTLLAFSKGFGGGA